MCATGSTRRCGLARLPVRLGPPLGVWSGDSPIPVVEVDGIFPTDHGLYFRTARCARAREGAGGAAIHRFIASPGDPWVRLWPTSSGDPQMGVGTPVPKCDHTGGVPSGCSDPMSGRMNCGNPTGSSDTMNCGDPNGGIGTGDPLGCGDPTGGGGIGQTRPRRARSWQNIGTCSRHPTAPESILVRRVECAKSRAGCAQDQSSQDRFRPSQRDWSTSPEIARAHRPSIKIARTWSTPLPNWANRLPKSTIAQINRSHFDRSRSRQAGTNLMSWR